MTAVSTYQIHVSVYCYHMFLLLVGDIFCPASLAGTCYITHIIAEPSAPCPFPFPAQARCIYSKVI